MVYETSVIIVLHARISDSTHFIIPTHFFSSYGSVWKAIHKQTGGIVAIKKVEIDNDLDDIMKEIDFMKGCRSPFIVRYYGSYFKDNELWVRIFFLEW